MNIQIMIACFVIMIVLSGLWPAIGQAASLSSGDYSEYEIYTPHAKKPVLQKSLFRESPRNALNENGLSGLFVTQTAEKLPSKRMLFGAMLSYKELTSRRQISYKQAEKGSVTTLNLSVNYSGDWAEWSVMLPVHDWELSAPRTYGRTASENNGIGNMRVGWKATYLPDRSYYRFAYGAVAEVTTGDPEGMVPTGAKADDELKLFGCVTTRETDYAVGNMELGVVINSRGEDNRFVYGFGLSYEASAHASIISEIAGSIQAGEDKDTMDCILGIRLSPTFSSVLELAYTRNLRTYREYGWDERLQIGTTIRW